MPPSFMDRDDASRAIVYESNYNQLLFNFMPLFTEPYLLPSFLLTSLKVECGCLIEKVPMKIVQ